MHSLRDATATEDGEADGAGIGGRIVHGRASNIADARPAANGPDPPTFMPTIDFQAADRLTAPTGGRVPFAPFGLVAAVFLLAWVGLIGFRTGDWSVLSGDQSGYYAYLPSLVIDGDLDFANQKMPAGVSDTENRWPVGVALTAAPAFFVAHGLSRVLDSFGLAGDWAAPGGYSPLYFLAVIGWLLLVAAAAAWLAARLLVERFGLSPRLAVLASLAWWLGTNVTWHVFRAPLLSHAPGAAWAIVAAYAAHRLLPRAGEAGRPPIRAAAAVLAFACSMLVVTRFTSALIAGPLAAAAVGGLLWRGRWRDVLRALPLAILACWPLAAQWAVLHAAQAPHAVAAAAAAMDQQAVGYGRNERFYWTRPALLRTLFSSRHGLFFWSPVLLFAAWGLLAGLRRRRLWRDPLLVALLVAFAALWYVNSAWYAWWFGGGFGPRAFVELAPLYVVGLGVAFARNQTLRPKPRRAAVALVLAAVAVNWLLMVLWAGRLISHDDYLVPLEQRTAVHGWDRI